VVVEDEENPCP